jgi:hypothetical protein
LGGKQRRVVIVDGDPQRSATAWWQAREADAPELVEADAAAIVPALRGIRAGGAGVVINQYCLPVLLAASAPCWHMRAAGPAVKEFDPNSRAAAEIRALARVAEQRLWQDARAVQPSI